LKKRKKRKKKKKKSKSRLEFAVAEEGAYFHCTAQVTVAQKLR